MYMYISKFIMYTSVIYIYTYTNISFFAVRMAGAHVCVSVGVLQRGTRKRAREKEISSTSPHTQIDL